MDEKRDALEYCKRREKRANCKKRRDSQSGNAKSDQNASEVMFSKEGAEKQNEWVCEIAHHRGCIGTAKRLGSKEEVSSKVNSLRSHCSGVLLLHSRVTRS